MSVIHLLGINGGGLKGGGTLLQDAEAEAGQARGLFDCVLPGGVGYVLHVHDDWLTFLQEPTPLFRTGFLHDFPEIIAV